jgi:hypothetical protein
MIEKWHTHSPDPDPREQRAIVATLCSAIYTPVPADNCGVKFIITGVIKLHIKAVFMFAP